MLLEVIFIALIASSVLSLLIHSLFKISDLPNLNNRLGDDDNDGGLDKFYDFPVVVFPPGAPLELLLQDRKPEHLYDLSERKSV
jgi:hypothetical protein